MYSSDLTLQSGSDKNDISELSIVTINGVKYVANLIWTPLSSAHEADVSKNELFYQLNSNNYCRFSPAKKLVQYGVVASDIENNHGLPVLAANIIHPEKKSFCGIWQTDDHLWVILAYDDDNGILVDSIVDSKEEARAELERAIIQYDYKEILVPDSSWGIEANDSYPPIENLVKKKSRCNLVNSKVRKKKGVVFAISLIAVLGTLYWGYGYWQGKVQEKKALEEQMAHAAQKNKIIASPPPWKNKPQKIEFIRKCVEAINRNLVDTTIIPGWSVDDSVDAVCDLDGVKYTIKRAGATINWYDFMKDHINIENPPKLTKLSNDKSELSWSVKFNIVPISSLTYSYDEILKYLNEEFSELNQENITFDDVKVNSGYPGWQVRDFTLNLKDNPYLYLPLLDRINNMTFTRLSYSASRKDWALKGALYEVISENNSE